MTKRIGKTRQVLWLCICAIVLMSPAQALRNPAAVYCRQMGYAYEIRETPEGEVGVCRFAGGDSCNGWDYLNGKCGEQYSYCKKEGMEQRIGTGTECGSANPKAECAVCVLPDGNVKDIIGLMNLSLSDGVCGDGTCLLGEDYTNCPQDCLSGGRDGYCDGVKDGRCDPDCRKGEDSDCPATSTTSTSTTSTTYVKKTNCGDGVCELATGEHYGNCPQDCPPGLGDGYCDKLRDGFCDPDCPPAADPDCGTGLTSTTLRDCGDGTCDGGENFGNCPVDCLSGGSDGYCDTVEDASCDADCPGNLDPDCKKKAMGFMDYLLYVSAFILAAVAIFLLYGKTKSQ